MVSRRNEPTINPSCSPFSADEAEGKDGEKDFQLEALRRHRVNRASQTLRELTERRLDALAMILAPIDQPTRMRTQTVLLAHYQQPNRCRLSEVVLEALVGEARIADYGATRGQLERHRTQAGNVAESTRT